MSKGFCAGALGFGGAWALISALGMLGSIDEGAKVEAWFWVVSFAASSAAAAYCFGRMMWGVAT